MKKKYFSVVFLALVVLAVALTSDKSVNVMKRIFSSGSTGQEKNPIVIVIDPGHPGTGIGQEKRYGARKTLWGMKNVIGHEKRYSE